MASLYIKALVYIYEAWRKASVYIKASVKGQCIHNSILMFDALSLFPALFFPRLSANLPGLSQFSGFLFVFWALPIHF